MRKNAKYVLLLIISIVLILVLFITFNRVNHHGEKSKEALIKAYLTALTNNDSQTILELTPSNYESRAAVQEVIKKYGGNQFKNIKIKYRDSELGGGWYAFINGLTLDKNGKSYPYKEQLFLRVGQDDPYTVIYDPQDKSVAENKKSDRWFLLLGKEKTPSSLFSQPYHSLGPPLKISPPNPETENIDQETKNRYKTTP